MGQRKQGKGGLVSVDRAANNRKEENGSGRKIVENGTTFSISINKKRGGFQSV